MAGGATPVGFEHRRSSSALPLAFRFDRLERSNRGEERFSAASSQVVPPDDRMAAHDRNDVGRFDRLFDVARRNKRRAVAAVGAYRVDDISPSADIDSLKRLVEQKQAAGGRLPPADHHLLLIASRQEIERVLRASTANAEAADDRIGRVPLALSTNESPGEP